jgi:type I restriction enzyme, S subunit
MSKVRIGDLVEFRRGISWSSAQERREPGENLVPVIRIPNIREHLDVSDLRWLSGVTGSQRNQFAASKGWILMVGSNGNPERIGNCVLLDEDSDFLFASFLVGLRPNPAVVHNRFLLFKLRSQDVRELLRVTVRGSTGLQNINLRALSRFKFELPGISEQRRIAEILDALDDQIEGTERVIAKLQLTGDGLLSDLLSGRTSRSARAPLDNIPKGWAVTQCRELCREITVGIVIRPVQYYRETGIPMLRSANVRSGQIVLDDLKFMSPSDHHRMSKTSVKPGDLVTVRTGYPGATAVIPIELPEANCIDIIVSRPGPRVVPEYLALWINSEFGKGQVLKVQGGLAQQHFNVSEMNSLRVALPPRPEQLKIVEVWAEHEARINAEIKVVEKLRLLKKGLEADLLTGRVRAPVEVAS